MKFKTFLFTTTVLLISSIWFEVISSQHENEEYDERCLSGIQTHLSKKLLEWGEITSKTPIENNISKNILKVGVYVVQKDTTQWLFFDKEDEFYISGYCAGGNPRNVQEGRMRSAMNVIDTIPAFANIKWKTLKEKNKVDHDEDFRQRGINLSVGKFDSTNYGHTEQAFLSDLLDQSDLDPLGICEGGALWQDHKAVIVMSSSNIACDKCSSSLTFSMCSDQFQFKERVLAGCSNLSIPVEYIQDGNLDWNHIPAVSIIFSSYNYRNIDGIKKLGHNKTYFFP